MEKNNAQKYSKTKFYCCPLFRTMSGLFSDEKKGSYPVGFYTSESCCVQKKPLEKNINIREMRRF